MPALGILPAVLALLLAAPASPAPPCSAGRLSPAPVSSTGAMGDELIVLRLRDEGGRCTLRGYPRVRPRAASGTPIRVREVRTRRPFPGGRRLPLRTVTLDTGGIAYLVLGYRGYDYHRARACRPLASTLDVAPPAGRRFRPVALRFAIGFCHRVVRVSPLVARRP